METDMNIQRYHTGPRMSQAATYNGFAFLAGQVAEKADGTTVAEQTADILAQITALLEEVGSDKTRILSATIWLVDMSTFAEMNVVWESWVAQGHTPARATVEAKLAAPQYKIEIGIIAALK
jgi:enamine deaminase RidA (YjgF/YER057c/UK114 family)